MKRTIKVSDQVRKAFSKDVPQPKHYEGNAELVISTGSTLLDLAISGGRIRGGGIPMGIMVEIFGPSSTGKTIMLCELAGNIHDAGGSVMFRDPEARLNKQFARLFGLDIEAIDYDTLDTVNKMFEEIARWEPESTSKPNGIFMDSLAALTSDWELDNKDDYGMRRAKLFSEGFRKVCRIIADKNILLACSNQVRQNANAGPYGQKYKSPGGEAIGFYSSLRLKTSSPTKIKERRSIHGIEHQKVVGIHLEVEVFKSSVWEPYHTAPLYILFDYGIDDIRANLRWLKMNLKSTKYVIGETQLSNKINDAIQAVEESSELERKLKEEVIGLWEEIEEKFSSKRRPRH